MANNGRLCSSEGDARNDFSRGLDNRFARPKSTNAQRLLPSPSLKRVITENVVQTRRQEFERFSQNPVGSNVTAFQPAKSNGCVRLSSTAYGTVQDPVQDQGKQLLFTPEAANHRFPPKPDIEQIGCSVSAEFQVDIENHSRQINRQCQEAPTLHSQPNQLSKHDLDIDISSLCVSNDLKSIPDSCNLHHLELHSKDGNNNCQSSEQDDVNSPTVVPETPVLPPPPKPPRWLSQLGYVSDGIFSQEFTCADGKYDYLANAVSMIVPAALTGETSMSEKIGGMSMSELLSTYASIDEIPENQDTEINAPQRSEKESGQSLSVIFPGASIGDFNVAEKNDDLDESTYACIGEIATSEFPEVKMPQKLEKESKKYPKSYYLSPSGKRKKGFRPGRSVCLDNPGYMFCHGGEVDDVFPRSPLIGKLNEISIDHKHDLMQEPVYDEPCVCSNNVQVESQNVDSAQVVVDGRGCASPDHGKNSIHDETQSRARSKVRHAYTVLRLPHETGVSPQMEDVAEEELQEQEQRLNYVNRVREKTSEAIAKYEKVKLKSAARLFQYGMVIGLDGNETSGFRPKLLYSIPNEIPESEAFVCNFCFPEVNLWTPEHIYEESQRFLDGELFSFVLTSETGDRRYGWCKRYLPSGPEPRLPEALCIVSSIGERGMYEQLLRALQEFRLHSMECCTDLMEVAYARPMPAPNKEVYIRTEVPKLGRQTIILKRELNSTFSIVPYSQLLEHLSVPVLLQAFGALLLERKIIFCASRLSTLSSCISAMVALLYPFEWQHTYVTVLTTSLIDIVEAPTPYIIGILTSMKSFLEDYDLSEVLLVDLDNGLILKGMGDESRIIPEKIQRALTASLKCDSGAQHASTSAKRRNNQVVSDETVSEAFIRLFVETCARYKDFIVEQDGEETTFKREQFVKAVDSQSIQLFLDWFSQTQMFDVFMSGKLSQNAVSSAKFDQRISEYQEEMKSMRKASLGRNKKRSLGKKISRFFRESGDKVKRKFKRFSL